MNWDVIVWHFKLFVLLAFVLFSIEKMVETAQRREVISRRRHSCQVDPDPGPGLFPGPRSCRDPSFLPLVYVVDPELILVHSPSLSYFPVNAQRLYLSSEFSFGCSPCIKLLCPFSSLNIFITSILTDCLSKPRFVTKDVITIGERGTVVWGYGA